MDNYKIAIPSHRRIDILAEQTWAYLQTTDVDMSEVRIFVSDAADAERYGARFGKKHVVFAGKPLRNIVEKFNAIHRHYPVGTQAVVMEDDVRLVEIVERTGDEAIRLREMTQVDPFVRRAFEQIPQGGIWGVAPHSNAFYFTGKVTRTLKLVVAHFFGFISTRDAALEVTQLGKSDYERTCLYFIKYGEVVRMDMVGVKTVSYTQEGGIGADSNHAARAENERVSCEHLVRRFPHLLKINDKKKSLFAELSFLRCTYDIDALQTIQAITDKAIGA